MTKLRWNNPPREADPTNFVNPYVIVKPIVKDKSGKKFNNVSIAFREVKQFEKKVAKLKKRLSHILEEENKLKKKIQNIDGDKFKKHMVIIKREKEILTTKMNDALSKYNEARSKASSFI